jgi:2-oxoacid:acceptor oxidoreductase gamma subunit (pyruvate/2-ketoisovalerate family)
MRKVRLHGRGGQGAVVASKILADAYFRRGLHVQAFPAFGMERRGAPVAAFVRAGREPVRHRGEIVDPNAVIVLDQAILSMVEVAKGAEPGAVVLLNHRLPPAELGLGPGLAVATVDATGIAVRHGIGSRLAPIVNTVILGAFARLDPELDQESVVAAVEAGSPSKAEANVAAAREAYQSLQIGEVAA